MNDHTTLARQVDSVIRQMQRILEEVDKRSATTGHVATKEQADYRVCRPYMEEAVKRCTSVARKLHTMGEQDVAGD